MEDVDLIIQNDDVEACHRIGKSGKKTCSKKSIIWFVDHKYFKKALINSRKVMNIIGA